MYDQTIINKNCMLKKQLLVLIIISCVGDLAAQSVVLVANGGSLYSFNVNPVSCSSNLLLNTSPCSGSPFSAALYKDTLYYSNVDPITSRYTVFQTVLGNNSYCKEFSIFSNPNNLTVDSSGIVYWIDSESRNLFSLNPHLDTIINHGQVNFVPAGDLIFYEGKLYLAAWSDGLIEINIQNPGESKIYMNTGEHSFWGLINIPVGCNKNQVFGIESNLMGESRLIKIDMENKTIGDVFCTVPFDVIDAASITETGIFKGISIASLTVHPDCGLIAHSGSINIKALSASPGNISFFLNGKATDNTGIFKNLSAGSYSFHIVSSEGCAIDTSIDIAQSAQLNFSVEIVPDTCNAGKGIIFINPSANSGTLTYYLNDRIQLSNIYNNLQTSTYKIGVEDGNKCRIDSDVLISNATLPSPISSIDIKPTTCKQNSGEINIHANTSLPLKFSLNNANPQTSGLFTGLDTGIYYVHVFESYCAFDTAIKISQQKTTKPIITFNTSAPDCFDKQDGSLEVNVSNAIFPLTISIDNNTFSQNTIYSNLGAGSHVVKIIDNDGCEWDTSATIASYLPVKPQVSFTVKNPQCWQSSFGTITTSIAGAENPYSFFINGNQYASGSKATNLLPGNYLIKIFNKNQCEVDSSHVSLVAESNGNNCDTIFIPSAFTPNNDGLNDILKPVISNFPTNILFQIYNRFGQKIFITTKINDGWNGVYKHQAQPSGTYVWTCKYSTNSGVQKFSKGTFVLIR